MIEATLFGKPLPDGGTIGVVAAASPYDVRSEVERGVEWWESPRLPRQARPTASSRATTTSPATPKRRADDLNALFADPEVDVVQALQGGYGSAQMIPYLDFDVIAANPKPFVGYSDITALHVADPAAHRPRRRFYGYGLVGRRATARRPRSRASACSHVLRGDGAGEVPRDPDDPYVRAIAPRQGDRAARRRLPLAPDPDDGHAVGDRARGRDPLLRGREARRRTSSTACSTS